jgi:hypothetical protein
MRKSHLFWILIAVTGLSLWGCVGYTRTEIDTYTISQRDTTINYYDKNTPGGRDNGIVYPSSRTYKAERNIMQTDSVVTREYPDFIRLGLFESVGLIGSGPTNSIGTGLFGVYPDLKGLFSNSKGGLFNGGIYRFGIIERRLRWFRDAKNWTWGFGGVEFIIPDAVSENALISIAPFYLRKRYFLREEIPYIAFTPSFGIGWFPSQYINLSASLDIGSIGGLNVRAYAGLAGGINSSSISKIVVDDVNGKTRSVTSVFPYFGIGVSVLDFLNLVPETEKEWKYHEHSSWDVGFFQFALINSFSGKPVFDLPDSTTFVTGYMLKFATASVALPLLDYKLYAGTSLLNLIVLGRDEYAIGILPLRLGYWQTILQDELTTEPFIEYNYYPSSAFHIGNRVNLRISEGFNVSFIIGFVTGSALNADRFGSDITSRIGNPNSFSRPYIGINISAFDRIFFPEHLRYFKK